MSSNIEFVVAAYGIWFVSFATYLVLLVRRSRSLERALARLSRAGVREDGGA